jgi:hypothetical protein
MTIDDLFERAANAEAWKYSDDTIERVEKVLTHEGKLTPWKFLETIEDWKLYHSMHPEWQGLNTAQITEVEGGEAFYYGFNKWSKQVTKTKEEKRKLTIQIFPDLNNDYSKLKTIDNWIEYRAQHPEWEELNTGEISDVDGGRAFYQVPSIQKMGGANN